MTMSPRRILRAAVVAVLLLLGRPAAAAPITIINATTPFRPGGTVFVLVTAATINGTGTVTSNGLDLSAGLYFGAWYLCTSTAGAPDVTLTWEASATTESTEFVAAVVTIHANLTAETAQVKQVQPPPMRYARVTVAGNAANPADTVCTVKMFVQGFRP